MHSFPVEPSRFGVFLGVMVVLAATPGPANLYSIATGLHKGKRAALTGVIGMNAATLVWFAAATIGLDVTTMSAYGLFGSSLATRLASERFRRGFNLFVGLILLLAATLIITHH